MPGRPPWGWYRLEPGWAETVVEAATVRPGDLVVDLGAGLTIPLLAAGARVIAVELHPGRAAALRRRLAGRDAAVVETDLRGFRAPGRPFRVVANPPFGLSAALLTMLGTTPALLRADLVLQSGVVRQLEAGERRSARRLTARWRLDLPRSAYTPVAPVDTSLVTLRPARRSVTSARTARPGPRSRAAPPR